MPDYHKGKIYKILNTIDNEIYVGSTCELLSQRMARHRSDCKRRAHLPLYKAMIEYGKEYFYIELLEKHPCSDKEELVKKENEYIRSLKPSMNQRGYVTCKITYAREYYHNNKTRRSIYCREYYQNNNTSLKEYRREYYQAAKEMITCECGCEITKRGLKQHIATKKHNQLLVK